MRTAMLEGLQTAFQRIVASYTPLRERLTWFWADHFSIAPRGSLVRAAAMSFVDEAVRPFMLGAFSDMLKAVMRHPSMLFYLDQHLSIGPDSRAAARSGRGLNENLARELLELHTLGVGSGYSQADVRATAELLTGLSIDPQRGFVFRANAAQPGPETVLGKSYGSDQRAQVDDIDAFLEDLALRPETARHLARKLAVHFLDDEPPEELIADLSATYQHSNGNLGEVTKVLLEHPDTGKLPLRKAKTPFEFIASSMVALGVDPSDISKFTARDLRRLIQRPLVTMGQPFMRPQGPDGWPEDPAHWITPQGLASRISWAVAFANLAGQQVEDPRMLLDQALGPIASDRLRFAVSAAETHVEGVALVLASAEFNRR